MINCLQIYFKYQANLEQFRLNLLDINSGIYKQFLSQINFYNIIG